MLFIVIKKIKKKKENDDGKVVRGETFYYWFFTCLWLLLQHITFSNITNFSLRAAAASFYDMFK